MRNRVLITGIISILFLSSCNKDFLETTPLSEFSSADVWKDRSLSVSFINGIYASIDQSLSKYMLAVYCDEGHRRDNSAILAFNRGEMTADNIIGWQSQPTWNGLYSKIRRCNLFLDNTIDAPFEKASMEGEVRFLRAFFYTQLTRMFGGVPLVKNAYELTDDFAIARSSYADCIDFIAAELDAAAALLPDIQTGDDNGRVTKGAALTLKSRVLLHAASDLHNTSAFSDYSDPALLGYTDGSRVDRWRAARDAAKAVIDLNLYSLHKADPAPGDSVAGNYVEVFLQKKTSEDIWVKFYTSGTIPNDNNMPVMNGPNGYGGQGNNAVSGNLVDAFEMKDGTAFDWNNPTHAALPYSNRDARFYANVLYDGAKWGTRPAYSIDLDPAGIVHTGYFERWNATANQMFIEPGIDSRNSPFQPGNSGQTLYLCKKFMDPNSPAVEGGIGQDVPYRHLRYAEVLLNYAEACLELDEFEEARTYINLIRKRAGQPETNETGDALKQRYRNERRIELMYEEHRFFDVRRWMIAPDTYGPLYKANVLYKLLPDRTTATTPTVVHEVLETRAWQNKAYFFPILRTEMNRNDLLVQNPGF